MTIFRLLLALVGLLAAELAAAPLLTTIQDVLYKANGAKFNGNLVISWNGFQAADNTTVVTQSATVKVIDGNLRVQLVPSTTGTPARTYSVTYSSDGRVMFTETWSVPSSGTPLKVKDVRVASGSSGGVVAPPPVIGALQESDVTGLIADLEARPLKGPGYAPGRVAIVNSTGALETAIGADGDCVRVDGSSGPCGGAGSGSGPSFVDAEPVAGLVDGANVVFTIAATPNPPGSLMVFRNGLLQKAASDYNVNGRNLQFVAAATPQPADTLLVSYRLGTVDPGTPQIFPNAQVLCSGLGATANAAALTSVGTCAIPSGTLLAGDRVEILFDFAHQGISSTFSVDIRWGATTVVHRDAPANESLVTGRSDVATLAAGSQVNAQSWGSVLPVVASAATAADAYAAGITIDFRASIANPAEFVTLRNFTVVRQP